MRKLCVVRGGCRGGATGDDAATVGPAREETEAPDGETPAQSAEISPQPSPDYEPQPPPAYGYGTGVARASSRWERRVCRHALRDGAAGFATPRSGGGADVARPLRLLSKRDRRRVWPRHGGRGPWLPSARRTGAGRPAQHGNAGCTWSFSRASTRRDFPRRDGD